MLSGLTLYRDGEQIPIDPKQPGGAQVLRTALLLVDQAQSITAKVWPETQAELKQEACLELVFTRPVVLKPERADGPPIEAQRVLIPLRGKSLRVQTPDGLRMFLYTYYDLTQRTPDGPWGTRASLEPVLRALADLGLSPSS